MECVGDMKLEKREDNEEYRKNPDFLHQRYYSSDIKSITIFIVEYYQN